MNEIETSRSRKEPKLGIPPSDVVLNASDAQFWDAEWIRPSAWITHVPFVFWLIETFRPEVVVELGTHTGVSYSAICQAVSELGHRSRCFAVDTWKGDKHAGFYDDDVYNELSTHHQERYAEFSTLMRATFDEASKEFSTGDINLLHIDGLHTYEAVKHDFETWKQKLADNAIVIFHDTTEMRDDFGVYRLWEELVEQYPSFSFTHGHGLGVLFVGHHYPAPLDALIEAQRSPRDRDRICKAFERLGKGLHEKLLHEKTREKLRETQKELTNKTSNSVSDASAEMLASLREKLTILSSEKSRLNDNCIGLQQEKSKLETVNSELSSKLTALTEKKITSDQARAELSRNVEILENEKAHLGKELAIQAFQLTDANAACAELKQSVENFKNANAQLSTDLAVHAQQVAESNRIRDQLSKDVGELDRENAKLTTELALSAEKLSQCEAHQLELALTAERLEQANAELTKNASETAELGRRIKKQNKLLKSLEMSSELAVPILHQLSEDRFDARKSRYRTASILQSVAQSQEDLLSLSIERAAKRTLLQRVLVGLVTALRSMLNAVSNIKIKIPFSSPTVDPERLQERKFLALLQGSDLFDPAYYLAQYPDVGKEHFDPYLHYCRHGWQEMRDPGPDFSTKGYLDLHEDVRAEGVNPLVHYEMYGRSEERQLILAEQEKRVKARAQPSKPLAKAQPSARAEITPSHDDQAFGPIIPADWEKRIELLGLLDDGSANLHQEFPATIRDQAQRIIDETKLTISVIMPTWNRVGVIDEAIASVLEQTHQPTELIIIDDGSSDGTLDHLRATYPELIENGTIKLVEGNHGGVSHARNLGLEQAKGHLIAYLDSDNTWRPDYLFAMISLFASSDELHTAYAALSGHDTINERFFERASRYDRKRLLDGNFIDLNVFMHTRQLYRQFGGFDTRLKRLVDWDLIITYTRLYEPAYVPLVGVDYKIADGLVNITTTIPLEENRQRVLQKHAAERFRLGLEPLRLAYIVYDFPALSQTFVTNEVRWLVENGIDVVAYHMIDPDKSAELDFPIRKVKVSSAEDLKNRLIEDNRNLCHSHFVYPTVTNFVWPACEELGIPFTVFPHAVDLFHESNIERNRIGELAQSDRCLKIFTYGKHHSDFLVEQGVPYEKIAYNFQVPGLADANNSTNNKLPWSVDGVKRGIVIARFIEKKGIPYLIEAVAELAKSDRAKIVIDIYGYGPEEETYRNTIRSRGLEDIVSLCGPISGPAALADVYRSADFLCAPCVVADNGDRDGFPTVILDAINEGIPVVTTTVSGIPDHLKDGVQAIVVPSRDARAYADGLKRLLNSSPQQVAAMTHRARQFAKAKVNLENTTKVYLDHWLNRPVDLFMVTYNTQKYEDSESTFEIIRRLKRHTTTPYTLTIVDNNSEAEFRQGLENVAEGDPNIRLLLKNDNLFCGPASNIAIRSGDARYAIYICSKEGFVMQHGWERHLMHFMDMNNDVAQAGHLCHLPRATYGRELSAIPEFPQFRNKEFAEANPNRPFAHVQGGCFIVRRDVFSELGGFNENVPQNNMDVEFSFMLESKGWKIAKIPELIALSIKTLPKLGAQFSERTAIIHPSNYEECTSELDLWLSDQVSQRCNVCGWTGDKFDLPPDGREVCPNCSSDGLDRLIFATLASDHRAHRKEHFAGLLRGVSLRDALGKRMFKEHALTSDPRVFREKLKKTENSLMLVLIDCDLLPTDADLERSLWEAIAFALKPDGKILFTDSQFGESTDKVIVPEALQSDFQVSFLEDYSELSAYDWRRLGEAIKSY